MSVLASNERRHVKVDVALPVGVFLVLHGFAHFVGLRSNVSSISDHKTRDLLGGAWHLSGSAGLGLLAAAWGVIGLAFIVVGVGVVRRAPGARRMVLVAATVSLVRSVVTLWAAVVGVALNAVLIAVAWRAPQRLGLSSHGG